MLDIRWLVFVFDGDAVHNGRYAFQNALRWMMSYITMLTHWGRDKMADIFQTTFSNSFSWMKIYWHHDNSCFLCHSKEVLNEPCQANFMTPWYGNDIRITDPLRRIHRRQVVYPHKGSFHCLSWCCIFITLNRLLNQQSNCRWFETPWPSCHITSPVGHV